MSYFKNQFSITPEVFQQMEGLRKSFVGELMTREQALDLIKAMGLPSESPKLWNFFLSTKSLLKREATGGLVIVFLKTCTAKRLLIDWRMSSIMENVLRRIRKFLVLRMRLQARLFLVQNSVSTTSNREVMRYSSSVQIS